MLLASQLSLVLWWRKTVPCFQRGAWKRKIYISALLWKDRPVRAPPHLWNTFLLHSLLWQFTLRSACVHVCGCVTEMGGQALPSSLTSNYALTLQLFESSTSQTQCASAHKERGGNAWTAKRKGGEYGSAVREWKFSSMQSLTLKWSTPDFRKELCLERNISFNLVFNDQELYLSEKG